MHVTIISGGNVEDGFFVSEAIKEANSIIAADQGARRAIEFGVIPKVVVGDGDSLGEMTKRDLIKKGALFVRAHATKDETDTQLAVEYAIKTGAKTITILGGTSDNRLDHVIANLLFTSRKDIPIQFVNGSQRAWIRQGPQRIAVYGKKGDLLSLIALSTEVSGIKTQGLVYALNNESLFLGKPRGVSNVLLETNASVQFEKGLLLFIQTALTK